MQIWIFPPGLFVLLMLTGFILEKHKKRTATIFMATAFILLWLLSAPVVSQWLIDGLQNQYPPLAFDKLSYDKQSAIVILGGGVENAIEYENQHMPSAITLSRLHFGAALHAKTQLLIIASGGNRNRNHFSDVKTESEVIQDELYKNYKIATYLIENKSRNTAEESEFLAPLLVQHHIHTIYLVTNAWHMPRSMMLFNDHLSQRGVKIIPAPMGYASVKTPHGLSNYLPLLNALNASVFALHEYVGIMWYKIRQL
jgi:uncharacterized SAM-binding protein YcdF (DUF218 family)